VFNEPQFRFFKFYTLDLYLKHFLSLESRVGLQVVIDAPCIGDTWTTAHNNYPFRW